MAQGQSRVAELDKVVLDIEDRVFPVEVLAHGTGFAGGKGKLEVTPQGVTFRLTAAFTGVTVEPFSASWGDVRELKNLLREKKWFRMNIGKDNDIMLKVTAKGDANEASLLASILDKLPPQASARRCPGCSSPVVGDVCQKCGTSRAAYERKRGLLHIGGGFLAGLVGLGLGVMAAETEIVMGLVLAVGIMLFGVVLLSYGVFKVVSGRRAPS